MTLALVLATSADAAPAPDLLERWTRHKPDSPMRVDHAAWTAFLGKYRVMAADGVARLRYGAVTDADRGSLRAYLERLSNTDVDGLDRPEQMAFWFNVYNALTVRTILEEYPVDSIRDISSGIFSSGPWRGDRISVAGVDLSLDDIEHGILRPIWKDPRIHYGVNCASIGCPNLPPEAFTADNLEKLLDQAARDFVNHPRGATVDAGDLTVSSIYTWFDEDFGGDDAGIIAHLRHFADPELKRDLEGITEIDGDRYDWRLNDVE